MAEKQEGKRLINAGPGKLQVLALVDGKEVKLIVPPNQSFLVTAKSAQMLMKYSHIKDAATVVPELNEIADLKKKLEAALAENAGLKKGKAPVNLVG